MKRIFLLPLVLGGAQLLLASDCGPLPPIPSSGAHDASDLIPQMQAADDGTTLVVTASLQEPEHGELVVLSDGDTLTATVDGVAQPLLEPADNFDRVYSTRFASSTHAVDVTVAFTRPSRPSAPSSTIHVPAPFTVLTPPPSTFTVGDTITVTLSRALTADDGTSQLDFLAPTEFGVTNGCAPVEANTSVTPLRAAPDGSLTASTSRILFDTDPSVPTLQACNSMMNVELQTIGQLDPAFSTKAGYDGALPLILGDQRRAFEVTVAPPSP